MDERIRNGPQPAFDRLTDRQKDCLRLLALPCSTKEVGARLGISPFTVNQHLSDARRLLGTQDSRTAARLLIDHERSPSPEKLTSHSPAIAGTHETQRSMPSSPIGEEPAPTFSRAMEDRAVFAPIPPSAPARRWPWPLPQGGREIDLSKTERLTASVGLTFILTIAIGIMLIAVTSFLQFLWDISRHGG